MMASDEDMTVQKTRILKSANGSSPSISIEAVVLSATPQVKVGADGKVVSRLEVTCVSKRVITNGATDVVTTPIPGCAYLLPTQNDKSSSASDEAAGPEASVVSGQKKKEPAAPRTLALSATPKTIFTHVVRTSVYLGNNNNNNAGGQQDAKNGDSKAGDASDIKAGDVVEIVGNVANFKENMLWFNSNKITRLRARSPDTMFDEFMSNEIAMASAMFASQAANGFFRPAYSSEAREHQAAIFREMWNVFVTETGASCASLARTLRSTASPMSQNDISNIAALEDHSERIKNTSPADVASGKQLMFLGTTPVTPDNPCFSAALVQKDKTPGCPYPEMIMKLWEGDTSKMPMSFCCLNVEEVKVDQALIEVLCSLIFVGNRDEAAAAFAKNQNPLLTTNYASLGIKLSGRNLASTVGTNEQAKFEMAIKQLLKYGNIAIVPKVSPKEEDVDGTRTAFPHACELSMHQSVRNTALEVSFEFVNEHLCGGTGHYNREVNEETVKMKDKTKMADLVITQSSLRTHGIQAISETFWDKRIKNPIDLPERKFYVLFENCCKILEEEGSLSVEEAEKKVLEAAGSDPFEFLTTKAIVYCIACK